MPAASRWPDCQGARHPTCAVCFYDAASVSLTRWPRPRRITMRMVPASKSAWCACRTSSVIEVAERKRNWTCSLLPVHVGDIPRRSPRGRSQLRLLLHTFSARCFAVCCEADVLDVHSKTASRCTRSARRNMRFACRPLLVTACTPVLGPPVTLAHQLARLRTRRKQDPELTNVLGEDAGLCRPLPLHTLLPGGIARDTVADNSWYS
jgi:hypothetical protein